MSLCVAGLDGKPIKCCERGGSHKDCYPIEIPGNDPFYSLFNRKCMNFVRSAPGLRYGCKLGTPLCFFYLSLTYTHKKKLYINILTKRKQRFISVPVAVSKVFPTSKIACTTAVVTDTKHAKI